MAALGLAAGVLPAFDLGSGQGAAWGQPAVSARGREYLSRRVVHVFDFEERQMGNYERLPQHWYVIGGPGYPAYTADQTGFDMATAVSGEYSLKMQSNGGSAGVIMEHGAIAAVPGADYVVAARAMTADMDNARIRMTGYFVDQHGRRIEPSVTHSPLAVSNGQWQRLEVRLAGDYEQAAWIVLKLELLQSAEFHPPMLGKQELYREDIGAAVWWDDVAIFQLPRIEIATQTPTNMIRSPDVPGLDIVVRDLTGERLVSTISVYDQAGQLVEQQRRDLDGRHTPAWTWEPDLPGYGWYWADLSVQGDRGLVGRRAVGWLWLPEARMQGVAEAGRFGIAAENLPADQRPLLRPMLRDIGSGAVLLDIWRADMTLEQLQKMEEKADPMIEQLLRDHQRLTLSLAQVPQMLAVQANTDVDLPLALLAGDAQYWKPALQATLVRYGQTVSRWQVGRVGSREGFERADLARLYDQLSDYFRTLSPEAAVGLPWSANQAMTRGADAAAALMVEVPTSIRPSQIPEYMATWPGASQRISLVLETLDPRDYAHPSRADDLALRIIHAWRSEPAAIYLKTPWHAGESRTTSLLPDPLAGVLANMIQRLGERRIVDHMYLGAGIACYILEGADDGALVVWNESADVDEASMELFLGPQPVMVDIWGNRQPLEHVEDRHRLPVRTTPVFIEGINAKLARFRAGLRFEPAFLQSSYKVHELSLQIANPWPQTINGRLRIDGMEQWTINPRLINFNIPAGGRISVPMQVTFPISELAGEKLINAQLEIEADTRYQLRVSTPLEIGLKDIEYHATLSIDPGAEGGGDVVVTAVVTNRGEQAQSLFAFAVASSEARQERIVSNLKAGQTIIKRFRFIDAAAELSGGRIRVGLREMDGPAMLNKMLDVP